MKILLINPPRSPANAILEHALDDARPFIHRKLIGPPLGLLTVAAAVREHDVTVLEMKAEYDLDPTAPEPAELVRRYLDRARPRIVGVTFIASEFPAGMEILRTVKRYDPRILTVAGGLHATLCPDHFHDPAADVVCTGTAHTLRDIVRAVESGSPLTDVPGVLVRTGRGHVPTSTPHVDIDPAGRDFIPPDRSHLSRWLSTYVVGRAPGPSTYLFTSLGCPYRCSFCSIWPQHGGKYLHRSVESVLRELKTLDEYPVVRFADANTLGDKAFVNRLFDGIEEEGISKEFVMDIRADTAAEEPALIARLARSGLKIAIVGFESFRQEELERYGKKLDVSLVERAIRVFHENGVMLRGNYIIPPDYDRGDFRALADFSAANPVSFAGYTILTPMPGTQHYDEVREAIVDHDLSKYNLFNCVMKTRLPLHEFYGEVAALWRIRQGTQTI